MQTTVIRDGPRIVAIAVRILLDRAPSSKVRRIALIPRMMSRQVALCQVTKIDRLVLLVVLARAATLRCSIVNALRHAVAALQLLQELLFAFELAGLTRATRGAATMNGRHLWQQRLRLSTPVFSR